MLLSTIGSPHRSSKKPDAPVAGSVSYYDDLIIFNFAEDYPTGQFANGDWWVHNNGDPVVITGITPNSVDDGTGRIINGAELNPVLDEQGYDSEIDNNTYVSELNVAPSITGSPLSLNEGSVVATISVAAPNSRPQIDAAAVLTVLTSAPESDAFRPPYMGTDKTIMGRASDLDYSILQSIAAPASAPSLSGLETQFARVRMEQNTSWTGRYLHPAQNQEDYGRDLARNFGHALLSLHLDYTNEQKENLYISIVQHGIDIYGSAREGNVWEDLGGHNQGRKTPMALAGQALNNSSILAYADRDTHAIFQEDLQTWYVIAYDVGRTLYTADGRPREEYITEDIGVPEWGEQHTRNETRDGRNWDAFYRNIVGASITGSAVAARLTGAESLWNHAPFFEYIDRFYAREVLGGNIGNGSNQIWDFDAAMYEAQQAL